LIDSFYAGFFVSHLKLKDFSSNFFSISLKLILIVLVPLAIGQQFLSLSTLNPYHLL